MNVSPINTKFNFKSFLPPQQFNKQDGWNELEKICNNTEKTRGMLHEQLKLLRANGDENILSLIHVPLDKSPNNESFTFRVYQNINDYNKDAERNWFFPRNHIPQMC